MEQIQIPKKHTFSRRRFLKIFGAALLGAGLGGSEPNTQNNSPKPAPDTPPQPHPIDSVQQSTQEPVKPAPAAETTDHDPLDTLMKEMPQAYRYQNFLYPVSQSTRLPETFPLNEAEIPLMTVTRDTIQPIPEGGEGVQIAEIMQPSLSDLFAAARDAGYVPYLRSGFRSIATQNQLFAKNVEVLTAKGMSEEEAFRVTNRSSAEGGNSEHHLGLAADIMDAQMPGYAAGDNTGWNIAREHYNRGLFGWIRENGHNHGFIISYPTGHTHHESKTGSGYPAAEPWHIRFIGRELATYMFENGYLDPNTPLAPNLLFQKSFLLRKM